jgi:hypothetical protein
MDTFTITTMDYQPGNYTVTFNYTDVYGQTFQETANLTLNRTCVIFIIVGTSLYDSFMGHPCGDDACRHLWHSAIDALSH